jgi:hypothetical protein
MAPRRLIPWFLLPCLILGCSLSPYNPPGGKVLQEDHGSDHLTRLVEAPGSFFVVRTWQWPDPRNSVCAFDTLGDAEEFYRRNVQKLPIPCEIVPYEPEGGKLVSEAGKGAHTARVFAVAGDFALVETKYDPYCHCGNRGRPHEAGFLDVKRIGRETHVCRFSTVQEAERFQQRLLQVTRDVEEIGRTMSDVERLCSSGPTIPAERSE